MKIIIDPLTLYLNFESNFDTWSLVFVFFHIIVLVKYVWHFCFDFGTASILHFYFMSNLKGETELILLLRDVEALDICYLNILNIRGNEHHLRSTTSAFICTLF